MINVADTWEAVDMLPEDMKKQYPVGGIIHPYGGARGVVVGYEMKVLYNSKPAWWVVIMHEDENGLLQPSAFSRFWLQNSKVKEVIPFDTSEELIKKAFKKCEF